MVPDDYDNAVLFASARAAAELRLLSLICPAPMQGMPAARAAGITGDSFSEPDLHLIWRGLMTAWQYRVMFDKARKGIAPTPNMTAKLCRNLLVEHGYWDDEGGPDAVEGSRWTPQSLAALFCRVDPTPELVRQAALRLRAAVDAERKGVAA